MYPTFHQYLATARVADLHHHAARERMAKAARCVQPHHRIRSGPGPTVTGLVRRVLTLASGHSPAPTR